MSISISPDISTTAVVLSKPLTLAATSASLVATPPPPPAMSPVSPPILSSKLTRMKEVVEKHLADQSSKENECERFGSIISREKERAGWVYRKYAEYLVKTLPELSPVDIKAALNDPVLSKILKQFVADSFLDKAYLKFIGTRGEIVSDNQAKELVNQLVYRLSQLLEKNILPTALRNEIERIRTSPISTSSKYDDFGRSKPPPLFTLKGSEVIERISKEAKEELRKRQDTESRTQAEMEVQVSAAEEREEELRALGVIRKDLEIIAASLGAS